MVGTIVVVLSVGVLLLVFSGSLTTVENSFGPTYTNVKAVFSNSQQLHVGDFVRIDGADVGTVQNIALDPGARSTTVTMQVRQTGPLYADARASLRWRLLLGGSFYVSIDRGTQSAGPLGSAVIPVSRTSGQVELDDIGSVVQGGARTGLQAMPKALASALAHPLVPGQDLATLAAVAPSVQAGVGALRGQLPDADLVSLMQNATTTMQALDTSNSDIRALVEGGAATMAVTAAREADLRSTFAQAPGTMQQTRLTMGQLNVTLALAHTLLEKLRDPATQVAPALDALRPTVLDADRLLRRAVPLLHALRPTVSSLARTARAAAPLLVALTPSLDRLDKTILPYISAIDPISKLSMAQTFGPAVATLSVAGASEDQVSHILEFPATAGSSLLELGCQENFGNPNSAQLIECKGLSQALQSVLSFLPKNAATHR
jgi:virulence factor Mce-like protein